MRKDDLLEMLRCRNTEESRDLKNKLAFLRKLYFKNELNQEEQNGYLNIHSEEALKAFSLPSRFQERFKEYCKELNGKTVDDYLKELDALFGFRKDNKMPRRGFDIDRVIIITPEEASKGSTRYIRINEKRVEVKVPAEVKNGTRLTIKGMGEESTNGGEPGNLYIYVHIKTDESVQEGTERNSYFNSINKHEETDDVQEEKIVVDPKKKYLCKYHHNTGCTSDKPGDGFSEKRCPGCGQFYMPLQDSLDWSNYASSDDPSYRDDENDIERIQNSYDPPEAIYDDDGNLEYW